MQKKPKISSSVHLNENETLPINNIYYNGEKDHNVNSEKTFIFDLDGVLIDSMPFHFQAWREAFGKVDIIISKDEVYEREGQKSEIAASEIYKKHTGKEPTSDLLNLIIEAKKDIFNRIFRLKIFPGVSGLLTLLRNKNAKIGLVTGSTYLAKMFHCRKEFLDIFDVIVAGEDSENSKPAPDPYIIAVQKLNALSEKCYVIENAPLGIKSAVAANLTCFAVKGTSPLSEETLKDAGAHFVFKDIEELKDHLVRLLLNE